MRKTIHRSSIVLVVLAAAGAVLWAQPPATDKPHGGTPDHIFWSPTELKWTEGPASLPAGAQMAVLEGDPAASGPFTMRLRFPAGYEVPPHFHPAIEHVTVISGKFNLGLGETFDRTKARTLPVSGFAVMNVGTKHFAFTTEETIIQLHGYGPWGITYVDPATDPRIKK